MTFDTEKIYKRAITRFLFGDNPPLDKVDMYCGDIQIYDDKVTFYHKTSYEIHNNQDTLDIVKSGVDNEFAYKTIYNESSSPDKKFNITYLCALEFAGADKDHINVKIYLSTDIKQDITKKQKLLKPETNIVNCSATNIRILNKNKKYKYRILFPLTRGVPILLIYESNIDLDNNLTNFFTNNPDILYNSLLESKMNVEEKIIREVYKSQEPIRSINPVEESSQLIDSYKNDTYEEIKDGDNIIVTTSNELGFKKIDYGVLDNQYNSIIYYYKDKPFSIINGIQLTPGRIDLISNITDAELAIYKKYAQCDIDITKLTENKNNLLSFGMQTLKDETVSYAFLRYIYKDEIQVTVQIMNDGQFMIEHITDPNSKNNVLNTYEINEGLIFSESILDSRIFNESFYGKTCEFGPYKYKYTAKSRYDIGTNGGFLQSGSFEYESAPLYFKIAQEYDKYDLTVNSYIYSDKDDYCLYRDDYGLLTKRMFKKS